MRNVEKQLVGRSQTTFATTAMPVDLISAFPCRNRRPTPRFFKGSRSCLLHQLGSEGDQFSTTVRGTSSAMTSGTSSRTRFPSGNTSKGWDSGSRRS